MNKKGESIALTIMIISALASFVLILAQSTPAVAQVVESAAANDPVHQEKVELCHKTKPDSLLWIVIEVDKAAEKTHLDHGDFPPNAPPPKVNKRCVDNNQCPIAPGDTVTRDCGVRVPVFGAGFCSCNCDVKLAAGGTATYTCKPKPGTCGTLSCKYNIEATNLVAPCSEGSLPNCKCILQRADTGEAFEKDCDQPATDCTGLTCDFKEGDTAELKSCTDTGNRCECLAKDKFGAPAARKCKA